MKMPTLHHLLHSQQQPGTHLAMPMLAAAWPQILEAPPVSSLGRPTLQHVQPLSSQLTVQLHHSPAQKTAGQHTRGHRLSSSQAATSQSACQITAT